MSSLSGGAQGRLLAALRYFDLIDFDGRPKELLFALAASEGGERQRGLRELIRGSYYFMFADGFDLTRASKQELQEAFLAQGMRGENSKKAISLFLALARTSGLKLSPHITLRHKRSADRRNDLLKSGRSKSKTASMPTTGCSDPLFGFPTFDPAWSESTKTSWFECFREFIRHTREARTFMTREKVV